MAMSFGPLKMKNYISQNSQMDRPTGLGYVSFLNSAGFVVMSAFIGASLLAVSINNPIVYWFSLSCILLAAVFMSKNALFLFTLASWAYLPLGYISPNATQSYLNPSTWLLLILLVRCRARLSNGNLYLFLLALIILSIWTVFSVNPSRSAAWVFQFLLLLYFASTAESIGKNIEYKKVFRGFAIICISLASLAVLEFIRRTPLLYNGGLLPEFYDSWKWQYYAVFRVTTTLGHPLNNGLFFAVAALVFLRQAALRPNKALLVGSAMACGFIVFLSASRTAIFSLAVGVIVLLFLYWKNIQTSAKVWLSLVGPILFIALSVSPLFQNILSRFQSGEGISSQTYRQDLLQWVDYFSRTFLFTGTGPGTSGILWGSYGNTSPLENGILQMWVSLGLLPTLAILLIAILAFFVRYRNNVGSLLCLIPIVAYLPFTNFIDSSSSFMPLCCLVLVLSNVGTTNEVAR
jgi:hypothetical protein